MYVFMYSHDEGTHVTFDLHCGKDFGMMPIRLKLYNDPSLKEDLLNVSTKCSRKLVVLKKIVMFRLIYFVYEEIEMCFIQ